MLSVDGVDENFELLRFTNTSEIRIRRERDFVLIRDQVLVSQVRKNAAADHNHIPEPRLGALNLLLWTVDRHNVRSTLACGEGDARVCFRFDILDVDMFFPSWMYRLGDLHTTAASTPV